MTGDGRMRSLEQARRDLMQTDPELYRYIEVRLVARTYKEAGDLAGGAVDNYGAANRCYAESGRFREKYEAMQT